MARLHTLALFLLLCTTVMPADADRDVLDITQHHASELELEKAGVEKQLAAKTSAVGKDIKAHGPGDKDPNDDNHLGCMQSTCDDQPRTDGKYACKGTSLLSCWYCPTYGYGCYKSKDAWINAGCSGNVCP